MTLCAPGTVAPSDLRSRYEEQAEIAQTLVVKAGSIDSATGTVEDKILRLTGVMKHMNSSQYETARRAVHAILSSPDQKPGAAHMLVKAISDFDCERVGFIADYHHLKPENRNTSFYLRLITALVRLESKDSVSYLCNLEAHLEAELTFPEDSYTSQDYYFNDEVMVRIINQRPDRLHDIYDYCQNRINRDCDGIDTTLLDEYLSHKSLADGWL